MEIFFQAGGASNWKSDIALVPVFEGEKILESCPELENAAPFLVIAPAMRDVSGRKEETLIVYGHPELPYSRVMFLGLGPQENVDLAEVRKAFARGVRQARSMHYHGVQIPYFCLKRFGESNRVLEEAVFACMRADHVLKSYMSSQQGLPQLDSLSIGFQDEFVPDLAREAARRGENAAWAVGLARDLANAPCNLLYPQTFADEAERLALDLPVRCEVFDEEYLEAHGFGAHLAVGKGGVHPPRLVVLEYAPRGQEEAPLIFVGKGITFDSGGISLKPAAKMHTMKSDMTGAAACLASLCALATERVEHRIIAVMALAENIPDAAAMRPSDVVTSFSGQTIEITNTDAEGRLVLCDALSYAQKRWPNASAIVDVATLTGACAVALGDQVAGLFSNNDELAERVISAGRCAGEAYWRMPLWEGYRQYLKSPIADMVNSSPVREGGAITAALFLQSFIQAQTTWAHLDIAGVDWLNKDTPLCSEGGTGFAARTLLELGRGGFGA